MTNFSKSVGSFVEVKQRSMWVETSVSDWNGEEQTGHEKLGSGLGLGSGVRLEIEELGVELELLKLGLGMGRRLGLALGLGLGLEEEEPRTLPWPLNLELEVVRFFMIPFIFKIELRNQSVREKRIRDLEKIFLCYLRGRQSR